MGIMWEEALHSALMPVTPQASMGSLAEGTLPHLKFTKLRENISQPLHHKLCTLIYTLGFLLFISSEVGRTHSNVPLTRV